MSLVSYRAIVFSLCPNSSLNNMPLLDSWVAEERTERPGRWLFLTCLLFSAFCSCDEAADFCISQRIDVLIFWWCARICPLQCKCYFVRSQPIDPSELPEWALLGELNPPECSLREHCKFSTSQTSGLRLLTLNLPHKGISAWLIFAVLLSHPSFLLTFLLMTYNTPKLRNMTQYPNPPHAVADKWKNQSCSTRTVMWKWCQTMLRCWWLFIASIHIAVGARLS